MQLTEAQRGLVEANVRLAQYVAHRLYDRTYGIEFEDVLQSAYLGLCKAAATFEEGRGTRFSFYAYSIMRNQIFMLYRNARQPSRRAICVPLDVVLDHDSDNTVERRALLDEKSDPADVLLDRLALNEYVDVMRDIARRLGPRIARVLELRLQGFKQDQIAARLGISQVQVSRDLKRIKTTIQARGGLAALSVRERQCRACTARSES